MAPKEHEAAKERMSAGKFLCSRGEEFSERVWHCQECSHHWPMDRDKCWNCHNGKRPEESFLRVAQTRDKIGSFAGVSGRTVEKIAAVVNSLAIKPGSPVGGLKEAGRAPLPFAARSGPTGNCDDRSPA